MASFCGRSPTNQREIEMTNNNVYLRDWSQPGVCPPESSSMMMHFNFQPKYSAGPFSQMLDSISNDCQTIISQECSSMMNGHSSTAAYDDDVDDDGINDAWRSGSMQLHMNDNEQHNHNSSSSSAILNVNGGQSSICLGLNQQEPELSSNVVQAAGGSQGGGLSLSLATQIPISSSSFHSHAYSIFTPHHHSSDHDTHNFNSCGLININSSKYLKAAQNLLDEIVNVHITFKQKAAAYSSHKLMMSLNNSSKDDNIGASKKNDGLLQSHPDHQESTHSPTSAAAEKIIPPSERKELQNKITQLLAMLDEVDRRYKQYYHQMQMIVTPFDSIAGCGAAKPYTSLPSQTISRHFRCLRDAISGQIQSARKILGDEESSSTKGCGISRLRYIDQHLRQQRAAMQQLGIMQPHAWRPQRGLPESSVSLLRAWLFEHFLHRYPNDSEKLMLARLSGLTRGQVSNWFINARVRLWKPMIEEMYREEFGGGEIESNSSSENTNKLKMDDNRGSCEGYDDEYSTAGRPTTNQSVRIPSMEMEKIMVGAGYDRSAALIQDDRRFMAPYNNNTSAVMGLTLGLQLGDDRTSPSAHLYNN